MTNKTKKMALSVLMAGVLMLPTTNVNAATKQSSGTYEGHGYDYQATIEKTRGTMYFSYYNNSQVTVRANLNYVPIGGGKSKNVISENSGTGSAYTVASANNFSYTVTMSFYGYVDGGQVVSGVVR